MKSRLALKERKMKTLLRKKYPEKERKMFENKKRLAFTCFGDGIINLGQSFDWNIFPSTSFVQEIQEHKYAT